MTLINFPLSKETQETISECLRLEDVTAQFVTDESAAKLHLQALQKKRVDVLVKQTGISPGAVEIRSATEKCVDLDSAISAARSKRTELTGQILRRLQADKASLVKDLDAVIVRLRAEEAELEIDYLAAMAAAAIAQMKYQGWWKEMKRRGPGFGPERLLSEGMHFFGIEVDRLCIEAGLDSSFQAPHWRIKNIESRIQSLHEAVDMEAVEVAISNARLAQAEGEPHISAAQLARVRL